MIVHEYAQYGEYLLVTPDKNSFGSLQLITSDNSKNLSLRHQVDRQDRADLPVLFESDHQKKLLMISFSASVVISSGEQIDQWKQGWCEALKAWHTPYKAIIDLREVKLGGTHSSEDQLRQLQKKFEVMIKFLKGFYLRKVAGWGAEDAQRDLWALDMFSSESEASEFLGIRSSGSARGESANFRQSIVIDNHFDQNIVEVSFSCSVSLDTPEQLKTLRSKLINNLMHWHTHWFLLWDLSGVSSLSSELAADVDSMLVFFRSFFMKKALGHSGPRELSSLKIPLLSLCRTRHHAMTLVDRERTDAAEANADPDSGDSSPQDPREPHGTPCASRARTSS